MGDAVPPAGDTGAATTASDASAPAALAAREDVAACGGGVDGCMVFLGFRAAAGAGEVASESVLPGDTAR